MLTDSRSLQYYKVGQIFLGTGVNNWTVKLLRLAGWNVLIFLLINVMVVTSAFLKNIWLENKTASYRMKKKVPDFSFYSI